MLSAKNYFSCHSLQKRDVISLLKKFKPKMKWNDNQKIIDIGCGPGDVSHDCLLPLIPSNGEMVGIDKSYSMIDIAKRYNTDNRSSFQVLDITESKVVEKFELYFDSVFSFYCLHWIRNHRIAMENIYSILKPGGETLMTWSVDDVIYAIYENLAASPKWFPYMRNFKEIIPFHRSSPDPASDVRDLMESIGFQVEQCSFDLNFYTFPSKEIFYKWMDGVNPFLKNIPLHLLDEFNEESKEITWNRNFVFRPILNEVTNEVTSRYTTISVFARK